MWSVLKIGGKLATFKWMFFIRFKVICYGWNLPALDMHSVHIQVQQRNNTLFPSKQWRHINLIGFQYSWLRLFSSIKICWSNEISEFVFRFYISPVFEVVFETFCTGNIFYEIFSLTEFRIKIKIMIILNITRQSGLDFYIDQCIVLKNSMHILCEMRRKYLLYLQSSCKIMKD